MQTLFIVKGIRAFDGGNFGATKATIYFITLWRPFCFYNPLWTIGIQRTQQNHLFNLLHLFNEKGCIINT